MPETKASRLCPQNIEDYVGPDFIIIGAMKAATTTLCNYLRRHPGLFMCTPKEPQYFSHEHVYRRGLQWYRNLFVEAHAGQVRGEASTCYSRWPAYPNVPERIKAFHPGMIFIYIMRHPVERSYSHYIHKMRHRVLTQSGPPISFRQAMIEIPEILDASLYMRQLERYLTCFDREQMLLLTSDELDARPGPTLERVLRFLRVEALDLTCCGKIHANRAWDGVARRRWIKTMNRVRSLPAMRWFIDMIPPTARRRLGGMVYGNSLALCLAQRKVKAMQMRLAPLDPQIRAELLQRFEEPTRALEAFSKRDLSHWRK